MNLNWFELEILFPTDLGGFDNGEDEKDDLLERIKLKNDGGKYRKEKGYFNLNEDIITAISPGYLLVEDGFKGHYSIVAFKSGATVTAVGKPEKIYEKLNQYAANISSDN